VDEDDLGPFVDRQVDSGFDHLLVRCSILNRDQQSPQLACHGSPPSETSVPQAHPAADGRHRGTPGLTLRPFADSRPAPRRRSRREKEAPSPAARRSSGGAQRVPRDGHPLRTFRAIVGKRSTPTPHGQFFVEEAVRLKTTDVGGPYALALSAPSDVLQEFDGGPGQIALHGLMNIGGTLGSAVSHGCIRLGNDMMRWLVIRIGAGTPVTITN
jgi:hypothetical protein